MIVCLRNFALIAFAACIVSQSALAVHNTKHLPPPPLCYQALLDLHLLRSRTSAGELPRLRLVRVNLRPTDPSNDLQLFGTRELWFGMEEFPKVLEVLPGVKIKIETRLTSENGQVQYIHITLRASDGDELGSFSLNYKGEFMTGQSYSSPEKLGFAKIFKHPTQVARLLSPDGYIFLSGKGGRTIHVQVEGSEGSPIANDEKPYSFQIASLVPNFITRPVFPRIHQAPSASAKNIVLGQTVDFVIDQVIDSGGRQKVFASLFRHRQFVGANGAEQWETTTVFPPFQAQPVEATPAPCWVSNNHDPSMDFESTVGGDRSKSNPSPSEPVTLMSYYVDADSVPPSLQLDVGKMIIDQGELNGSYRYRVYWMKNWDPNNKDRVPTSEELVGESDWSEFEGIEMWTVQWLKPNFQEVFLDNWSQIKKTFHPAERSE